MAKTFRSFTRHDQGVLNSIAHVMPLRSETVGAVCDEFANLGDATGFPPEALNPDAPLDQVVLALALICNDMIDAFSVVGRMDEGASVSAPKTPTPYEGARSGRRGWASRALASMIHEALETLQTHQKLLHTDPEVTETLASMTSKNVTAWNDLMALALARDKEPRRQFLLRIRNKVSYHYADTKPLVEGYKRAFIESEKTAFNERAYVSAGATFEGLRFYFADAAVAAATQSTAERTSDDPMKELTNVAAMTVNGLINFVLMFMDMRVGKLVNAAKRQGR